MRSSYARKYFLLEFVGGKKGQDLPQEFNCQSNHKSRITEINLRFGHHPGSCNFGCQNVRVTNVIRPFEVSQRECLHNFELGLFTANLPDLGNQSMTVEGVAHLAIVAVQIASERNPIATNS